MQSIFRYPGGKSKKKSRDWILGNRPQKVGEYREPFVGGGGIFFGLRGVDNRWINDLSSGLIAVYMALRDRPKEFIAKCREVSPARDGEELTEPGPRGDARYNKRLKDLFESVCLNTECDQAFRYFFVNRTVFGGRVNYDIPSRLYFSNPGGWNIVETDKLEKAAEALEGVKITCGDYEPLFMEPGKDVWIYADPPYVVNGNLTPTSQLYQHGFGIEDHRRFADVVGRSQHRICVSYDDDKDGIVRDLFKGFRIEEGSWTYCGTTNDEKKAGRELLIMNYNPHAVSVPAPSVKPNPARGMASMTTSLTADDKTILATCEETIERGLKTFHEVGAALLKIRDGRLYRHKHKTFEQYCRDRWGFTRMRASQLIASASVCENVNHGLQTQSINERQARELARLPAAQQQDAWQEAIEQTDGKPTAAVVREIVERRLEPTPEPIEPEVIEDGPCPHGGEHEFCDEGHCVKCFEPAPDAEDEPAEPNHIGLFKESLLDLINALREERPDLAIATIRIFAEQVFDSLDT